MSLRDYDKWTPRERADRAATLAELKAKGVVKVVEKWHIGADGEVDHHSVEPLTPEPQTEEPKEPAANPCEHGVRWSGSQSCVPCLLDVYFGNRSLDDLPKWEPKK